MDNNGKWGMVISHSSFFYQKNTALVFRRISLHNSAKYGRAVFFFAGKRHSRYSRAHIMQYNITIMQKNCQENTAEKNDKNISGFLCNR